MYDTTSHAQGEPTVTCNANTQRILIWLTLILIVIYGVGYLMLGFFPPPEPSLDAGQVQHLYAAHNTRFRIGIVLCLFSGAFLLPWSVVVGFQMARLEKGFPAWAILQFGAAIIGTIFLWGPPLLWGAAAFSIERNPALTLILHEVGWLTFITPLCAFPMQLIAVGVVSLTCHDASPFPAFPRWVGYLTLWQAVQSLGGLAAMLFKQGVFAWNGLFPFYLPVTLYFVWTVAVAWTMLRAIRHQ
jgi:hypothetical protein